MQGWLRNGRGQLREITDMQQWRSPWLGIRFTITSEGRLYLTYPDGSPFLTFAELNRRRQQAETTMLHQMALAETEAARAEAEAARAEVEAARAETEYQARLAAEARIQELEEKLRQAGLFP